MKTMRFRRIGNVPAFAAVLVLASLAPQRFTCFVQGGLTPSGANNVTSKYNMP